MSHKCYVAQMLCHTNVLADKCCGGRILCRTNVVLLKCCVAQMLCRTNVVSNKCGVKQMLCCSNVVLHKCFGGQMLWQTNVVVDISNCFSPKPKPCIPSSSKKSKALKMPEIEIKCKLVFQLGKKSSKMIFFQNFC